jgi:Flp pilus assembly protein TadG
VRRRTERGSATLELAILAPALLAIAALAVLAGRVETARLVVAQAAEDAARAATLSRTDSGALADAGAVASDDLSGGTDCSSWTMSASGSLKPGSTVSAVVTCSNPLGLLPGDYTATGSASSIVDVYRGTG